MKQKGLFFQVLQRLLVLAAHDTADVVLHLAGMAVVGIAAGATDPTRTHTLDVALLLREKHKSPVRRCALQDPDRNFFRFAADALGYGVEIYLKGDLTK